MRAINTEVVVVGAGVAGLCAALALARAGLKVAHLRHTEAGNTQQDPAAAFDRRVYAIAPASRHFLESLGVWQALPVARIAPVYDMRVFPTAGADARELHLSAYEAGCEGLAWIVESGSLLAVLEQAMGFARIKSLVGSVKSIDTDSAPHQTGVTLVDGQVIRARLVVAADGAGSPVRGLAGIATTDKPYHQKALVAPLAIERAHRDSAWQWFGEHGVLAVLPLPRHPSLDFSDPSTGVVPDQGGHRASLVWSTNTRLAKQLLADGPQALSAELTALAGHCLGRIQVLEPAIGFDLRLRQSQSLVAPRLALVGDAAHVIHPLAGQGLNLGIADVASLAELLGQARGHYRKANFDPGSALLLRRYQRHRSEPVFAMQQITDTLSRVFDSAQPWFPGLPGLPRQPLESLRDTGWALATSSSLLRQQFVRYATQKY